MNSEYFKQPYPDRHYVRIDGFDYSSNGAYFITTCTYQKQPLFGQIQDDSMKLNQLGEIVQAVWKDLPSHYPDANVDTFIVMPNHVHGIVFIQQNDRRSSSKLDPSRIHTLTEIMRGFKTYSARRINEVRNYPGTTIWQRSFNEHVIRTEKEYHQTGQYILYNPQKWADDTENPGR